MTPIERLLIHIVGGGLLVGMGFALKLLWTACPAPVCMANQARVMKLEVNGSVPLEKRVTRLERLIERGH